MFQGDKETPPDATFDALVAEIEAEHFEELYKCDQVVHLGDFRVK